MKAVLHFKQRTIAVLFLSLCSTVLFAQGTPKKTKPAPNKFNPTKVKSYLGKFTGKDAKATAAEGKQVVALPLRITDDKNVTYKLSSYQFAYTKWGAVEDETTKQISQKSTLSADRFTSSPLPTIWIENITENLHTGEELYFYDIIAFAPDGSRFFAPEIKIVIQ
ncbi:hypothetical protein ACQ33O_09470 [Ferruginibacter sp. SUN002]|uniref:hypothetical protein n=1 Tax=Ferruginibacter sp. SUN002 TaxID=2937789 RepID=UPI003D36F3B2